MEQLISAVQQALREKGLHVMTLGQASPAPRLESPACAVRLESAKLDSPGFAQYLGTFDDGAHGMQERYGARLSAVAAIEVFSPTGNGMTACDAAGSLVMAALLGGVEGVTVGRVETQSSRYDAQYDHVACTVRAELGAWVYGESAEQVQALTEICLKGELQ